MKKLIFPFLAAGIMAGCSQEFQASDKISKDYKIELKSRTFTPSGDKVIESELLNEIIFNEKAKMHVIVQYKHNLTQKELKGIEILAPIASNTYFASINAGFEVLEALNDDNLRYMGRILPEDKISSHIGDNAPSWSYDRENQGFNIILHGDADIEKAKNGLESLGASVNSIVEPLKLLNVAVDKDSADYFVKNAAILDNIQYIGYPSIPLSELNHNAQDVSNVDVVQYFHPELDGTGMKACVYDGGLVYEEHPDLEGRVTVPYDDGPSRSAHATHVAGILGGDGTATVEALRKRCSKSTIDEYFEEICELFNTSEDEMQFDRMFRGVAPKVKILAMEHGDCDPYCVYNTPNNLLVKYMEAIAWGAALVTNSIGSNVSLNEFPCEFNGDYELTSFLVDFFGHGAFGLKPFTMFVAAGNERAEIHFRGDPHPCFTDEVGYRTLGIPATSKNAIVVGASMYGELGNIVVADYTGFGPADDGRVGITVVNFGGGEFQKIISTTAFKPIFGNLYAPKMGSSMATPLTAAIGILLNQQYRILGYGDEISPQLMKVLLAGSAWDIGQRYVDFQSGFGHVDADNAFHFMENRMYRESLIRDTGDIAVYNIAVKNAARPVKITMAYQDIPGVPNSLKALKNDLDIVLYTPSGKAIYPKVLDPDNPGEMAVDGEDHTNNIEQIVYPVQKEDLGLWKLVVSGYDVVEGPVDFAVASNVGFYGWPDFLDEGDRVRPFD
ncbi:MAG: S8 family serine peptidase [Candidatus Woesearchaeota archaeon]